MRFLAATSSEMSGPSANCSYKYTTPDPNSSYALIRPKKGQATQNKDRGMSQESEGVTCKSDSSSCIWHAYCNTHTRNNKLIPHRRHRGSKRCVRNTHMRAGRGLQGEVTFADGGAVSTNFIRSSGVRKHRTRVHRALTVATRTCHKAIIMPEKHKHMQTKYSRHTYP